MFHEITICCIYDSSNLHDTTVTAGLMHITAPQMYMTPLSHSQLVWCISWQLKCTWHHCHSWSDAYHSIWCKLGQCAYTKWLGAFIALTVCCCCFDKGQECILKSLNLNHSLDNTPPPHPSPHITCGKSCMPSWWANMARVSRLVMCSARAVWYRSGEATR